MAEAFHPDTAYRHQSGTLRADRVASAQWGVIGTAQLRACGVGANQAARWREAGRLHLLHPSVHALGHTSVPVEGRMVAALLHAGSAAVLSHGTAAWWWGLLDEAPAVIEVSTRRHVASHNGVVVHRRRELESTRHRRFPITTLSQTFLDLAAATPLATVRRALATADYRRVLDAEAVAAIAGRGKPGTRQLREALRRHQPLLAHTRSWLERAFLALVEGAGLPLPTLNVVIEGWPVDVFWRDEGVVAELDGVDNHHSPGQIDRDRRKELALRAIGLVVLRYSTPQVAEQGALVIADLRANL